MPQICQTDFPTALSVPRPLPGVAPLEPDGWITVDEVYGAQTAYRSALMDSHRDVVMASCPGSEAAQSEALEAALAVLAARDDFEVGPAKVVCPDGRHVPLDAAPLEVLSHLVQEDICLLERADADAEHVLTAGVMCFPASWMLQEKIGRPLMGVHAPVTEYDDALGKRVQRLFDGVQVGRPLWRFNRLWYADADLFQPRAEAARRDPVTAQSYDFLRMEKQSILRLPRTRAVVFSIHTYVLRRQDVPADVEARLAE